MIPFLGKKIMQDNLLLLDFHWKYLKNFRWLQNDIKKKSMGCDLRKNRMKPLTSHVIQGKLHNFLRLSE